MMLRTTTLSRRLVLLTYPNLVFGPTGTKSRRRMTEDGPWAISSMLERGEGWDEKLQSSLFTGDSFHAKAESQQSVVQPSYGTWILALGVLAIASALVGIALLANIVKAPWTWSNRGLAAAYTLALLASFNLMVMHLIVHGLSPARGQGDGDGTMLIGMTWNEAFFWRSLFCLACSLPYSWYVSAILSQSCTGRTCTHPARHDSQAQ